MAQQANGSVEYVYDGNGNLVKSIIGDVITYYPNTSYEMRVEDTTEVELKYYRGLCTPERSERGNLVKSIIGDNETYYPNGNYELRVEDSTEVELKYYFVGSVRVAVRENETITWLLSDHLGSTSVTVDATGNLLSALKYTAYGELRSGTSTTDYQYTGQRSEIEIGLYFYVARMYDPQLARFISADTIIPEPGKSQGYDRYAYVNGNPISFNDPSGHRACDDDYGRGCNKVNPPGSGGGSGGGYNYGDGGSNDFDSPFNNTIIDYIRGWQLVGTAWSIFNNPDAGWEAWGISGGYMLGWVGAHVALGVGVGGLVCVATGPGCVAAVEGVLGIGGVVEQQKT